MCFCIYHKVDLFMPNLLRSSGVRLSTFQLNQDEFLQHYYDRSNVETPFFAVKVKFDYSVKNKNFVSPTNEVLCKLIARNITVLINAMYES